MATKSIILPAAGLIPTGACYQTRPVDDLSLTNTLTGGFAVVAMPDPGGTGDHGVVGSVPIPADYVGTPVMRVVGILDGTPANNLTFAQQSVVAADNGAFDAALGTQNTDQNALSGYTDEDVLVTSFAITNGPPVASNLWTFVLNIDDSEASPFTGAFLLTHIVLEYADA